MYAKKIFVLLCLVFFISTSFVYATENIDTQDTNESEERILTRDSEKKSLSLDINVPLDKTVVEEEKTTDTTSKITGLVSYASSGIIVLIFVFVFIFVLNIYLSVKKK